MNQKAKIEIIILGVCIFLGLTALGFFISSATKTFKMYDRSVTVKGLSEKEYMADIVIWPIQFVVADNDLTSLYRSLDEQAASIREFLMENGLTEDEISVSVPAITDKSAQSYGDVTNAQFRYVASQSVTVYSSNIEVARKVMNSLSTLGKKGIVFSGADYRTSIEYLFTRLNEVKPDMIEEATTKAREVALKFAEDSQSRLGKIKRASQGQFSIGVRDANNPHIKKVRVVSTIEYYLAD
jgi:hypothetical protein